MEETSNQMPARKHEINTIKFNENEKQKVIEAGKGPKIIVYEDVEKNITNIIGENPLNITLVPNREIEDKQRD